jgi:hypothetical protein
MDCRKFVEFLNVIEKLKCNTRHSWTSSGRKESVAEHSWRLAVMAMLCADEYPDVDIKYAILEVSFKYMYSEHCKRYLQLVHNQLTEYGIKLDIYVDKK